MPTHRNHHDNTYPFFVTFTCYQHIPLLSITKSSTLVYNWFRVLNEKNVKVYGFVIMPNHIHCLLNLSNESVSLNKIVANGKRFIAYGIIDKLQHEGRINILKRLRAGITPSERKSGKIHKVFKPSFDAQICSSQNDLETFLHYIHTNPVAGKWNLAKDYLTYKHSSARFYDLQEKFDFGFELTHYLDD